MCWSSRTRAGGCGSASTAKGLASCVRGEHFQGGVDAAVEVVGVDVEGAGVVAGGADRVDVAMLWSADGLAWSSVGSFDDVLAVSSVGVYAGNSGTTVNNAPAFESRVDYVFDTAAPIADDPDLYAPTISDIVVLPGSSAADISWVTSEPTTATVEYGLTASYGQSVAGSSTSGSAVKLPGLTASSEYHYRIVVRDELATRHQRRPHLHDDDTTGPGHRHVVRPRQVFGRNGLPQPWVNVVGNVRDGDGLSSLHYSLNGGVPKDMGLGSDTRRLQDPGDFNADIRTSALTAGDNRVVFTAKDMLGHVPQEHGHCGLGGRPCTDTALRTFLAGGRPVAGAGPGR